MWKGLSNLASLMANANSLGAKMNEVMDKLKSERVTGSAGGQMVTVTANGLGQVLQVKIDPELDWQNDRELIQDLLPPAINDACSKAKQRHLELMKEVTGGLNLPGLDQALQQFSS